MRLASASERDAVDSPLPDIDSEIFSADAFAQSPAHIIFFHPFAAAVPKKSLLLAGKQIIILSWK
jgi:hypothetical protein